MEIHNKEVFVLKHEIKQFINEKLCPTIGCKEIEISLPVAIKGFAEVGEVDTKCCGPAEIIPNSDHCPGDRDAVARFVIRQKIVVEVPVDFGVKTDVGDAMVDFDDRIERRTECGCER